MYRVTVTQDPKEPSQVRYQDTNPLEARSLFLDFVSDGEYSCVEMYVWDAQNGSKGRGKWLTKELYKRYR